MEIYGMTGERLGTIGDPHKKDETLPQWKRDFLTKPSISVRRGIAWSYNPPTEPTSTLVLTAPSNKFIDVRFPVRPPPSQPLTADPHFWAFCGTASTTFDPDPDGDDQDLTPMPYSAHSVWKHDIDTQGSGISDEGEMFVLANGECMEVGMMRNPASGKVEMYREYWTGPAVEVGSGGVNKAPCVVAEAVDGGKGLIMRVGDHCQGIRQLEQGGEVLVERWLRSPVEEMEEGRGDEASWLRDWRSNTDGDELVDVVIPCMWACGEARKVGDEITARGVRWTISEVIH